MMGLFGALEMGQRSLQVQRQGVEVTGHNLANINNPNYARQRVEIRSAEALSYPDHIVGTGSEVAAITQLRNNFVDRQIQTEASTTGYLEAKQTALEFAQTNLGELIDSMATSAEGSAAASGSGGQHGLSQGLSKLFNTFQSLSTKPSDPTERLLVIQQAQSLSGTFRETSERLGDLKRTLDDTLSDDTKQVNQLLGDIANLNAAISREELNASSTANDLRDARLGKLEELSKLTNIEVSEGDMGMVDISINGTALVTGSKREDEVEVYDAGGGQMLVRTKAGSIPLSLTGGHMQGTIEARDNDLQTLQNGIDKVASALISAVNAIHETGYGLDGTSGEPFFAGTNAADIRVNSVLVEDNRRIQAAGISGTAGDNRVMLQLAQLGTKAQAGLGNLTFSQSYGQTVAGLGQALSTANSEASDQQVVTEMLKRQQESVSGVSMDEEMTNLVKFQRAYQASARFINTIDSMFDDVMNLKR